MTTPLVIVTDHAIVQFLERVGGVDIAALRAGIAAACARHQGAPCVRAMDARFLIRGGRVVTTLSAATIPHHAVLTALQHDRTRG